MQLLENRSSELVTVETVQLKVANFGLNEFKYVELDLCSGIQLSI